jgi:hypothetical protein
MADSGNQLDQTAVDRSATDDDYPRRTAMQSAPWTRLCLAVNRSASADSNTDTTTTRGRGRRR